MNQNKWLGFFFYSEKQAQSYYNRNCPLPKAKLEDGTIREYTEWVTDGIKPSGSWDDYVALGRVEIEKVEAA